VGGPRPAFAIGRRAAVASLVAAMATMAAAAQASAADFRDDWAVEKGFTVEVDTKGYGLPTAIAFVPHPGGSPKSPLYFVAELHTGLKVVTRDRTVRRFAAIDVNPGKTTFPELHSQTGVTGVCLDEAHGYVYAAYSANKPNGEQQSRVVRYSTAPRTFALAPSGSVDLSAPLAPYPTQPNHQMGSCAVADGSLWIGIGDGGVPRRSRDLDDLVGKVLRLTLDGKPDPHNPFYRGSGSRRYVWSYGFRNPFGVAVVGQQVFVTHNGEAIDSFVRVRRGVDQGWSGTDPSIAANAAAVIAPSVGPAHVAYYPATGSLFPPRYGSSFFFATSVGAGEQGAGVWRLRYDLARDLVTDPPASFVRSRRDRAGAVAAVAVGPDGLYFAGIEPSSAGETPVYRVRYAPQARYPHSLGLEQSGNTLFIQHGCRECHSLGGLGGTAAPPLDHDQLVKGVSRRLDSRDYRDLVARLDRRRDEPFVSFRKARHEVLAASGERRLELWLEYRIVEPRFDDPGAAMPNLGIGERQAEAIAGYLLHPERQGVRPKESFARRARHVATSKRFAAGFAGGLAVAAAAAFLVRRRRLA
jgi:glucose/arabinose dehydrogenase